MWHCIFSHVEFRLFTWTKTHYNYEIWKVKEKKLVSFKFLNILLTNRFRISGPGSASNHVPGRREITIYHERVDFVVLLSTFSVFSTWFFFGNWPSNKITVVLTISCTVDGWKFEFIMETRNRRQWKIRFEGGLTTCKKRNTN